MRPSESLCPSFRHDLFRNYVDPKNRAGEDGYLRAEAIARVHGLTLDDIMSLSPKFWDMHTDPIICLDGAATTLLTIQYNLAAGTLGAFVSERDDILALVKDIIDFRTIGQFCLTELEHGLDAFNLETTAVLLDDGRFELHTPHPGAAKFMPPTTPVLGRPCFAVVFAQLLAKGICQGIRPFVVCLNDGFKMCPGISARILPQRGNSAPVNHCLTTFDRVILPSSALLGDMIISGPPRLHFLSSIWRVAVGTLALTSIAIPGLAIASHIALQYSLRRLVRGNDGDIIPIFNFRTQQTPILTTIAQAFVLRAFHQQAVRHFVDDGLSPFVQHGIATCFKAVVVRDTLGSHSTLSERCGAQGLFGYNRLIVHHDEMRGVAIAEGDVLVLSIRQRDFELIPLATYVPEGLATELLLEKYSLPPPENFSSLLALHEDGLLTKYKSVTTNDGGHRSAKFGSHVIPHCERIVRAIGYRMAYDAAVSAKVPQGLIDLFVCNVVKADLGWYIQNQLLSSDELEAMEDSAIQMSLPHVEKWVAEMEVEPYVASPIISKARWDDFCSDLQNIDNNVTAKL
ncbi:Acyl-CoA dehydrogenase NM domain-like protein [Mycena venus]|uniref:Acyl-CoA dehydrogenase NM domain-like protein n=1 Tax=Mycena venus TaxID=2733690 RepID=A0A8H6YLH1_9AGAR|nr:Acyl-CoA dehydrogenase NM domain-like protein [Mycena venus]